MNQNIKLAHQSNATVLPNGTLQSRISWQTKRNNNIMVLGTSGSGKTRGLVMPNICAMLGSYVISDPKGNLYRNYSAQFQQNGYHVIHLDFIHPENSQKYNPFAYLQNSDDIMRLSKMIVYAEATGNEPDAFWNHSSELLFSTLIAFLMEVNQLQQKYYVPEFVKWEYNLLDIYTLLDMIDPESISDNKPCEIDREFHLLERIWKQYEKTESVACRMWRKFNQNPPKTLACVVMTLHSILTELDTAGIRQMLSRNEVDFASIGSQKTIVFVEISDTDRSKDLLANIFYSQAMNALCTFADSKPDSRLPVPVQFILDDFGTNCKIKGFENMIANIRSREISVMLMLQSQTQLEANYGVSAHTIMENCDTTIYMGGNDPVTAETIAKRCNVPVYQILNMPISTNWVICRGEKPVFGHTIDISEYELLPVRSRFTERTT